jgi:ABC-type phosphate transport system substrate-binding protein
MWPHAEILNPHSLGVRISEGGFMKHSKKTLTALAVGALAVGLLASGGGVAQADAAPTANDIVGVGSDTLQYMLDFGADGDTNGHAGYNTGKSARIVSFDATPDANARAGYLNGSTNTSLKALNPTIVLRAGSQPRQRPNGSGAGMNAMLGDTASPNIINFVRSSSPLSAGQIATATAAGGIGAIHEIRLAKESLGIATANTTNAPTLSAAQLKDIYLCNSTTWDQVGGTSTNTIVPVIPQAGSGTRKTFLTDIGFTVDGSGNVTQSVGSCVKTGEENDPYSLYIDGTGSQVADPYATAAVPNPDAIAPFSGARLNLYTAGYFFNPNVALGAAVPAADQGVLAPAIKLNTAGYVDTRGLYVFFREADTTSTAHFNGSAKNWVNTLFYAASGTPFFKGATGQALLTSAGVTPAYSDCGVNIAAASGCGP